MKGTSRPTVPAVPTHVWRNLYEAALRFKELEPWKLLNDSQLFGVQDPVTRQRGYCCVLGALGEVFALCIYRGASGLEIYRRMQVQDFDSDGEDFFAMQDCLMAEFSSRDQLRKPDLEVIKSLEYRFKGSHSWPQFRSYLPGYVPWYLTEQEAQFMTFALHSAVDLAPKIKERSLKLGSQQRPHRYLFYVPEPSTTTVEARLPFTIEWMPAEPPQRKDLLPYTMNEVAEIRIRKMTLKADSAWEADSFFLPSEIADRDRPYFMRLVMLAHEKSGYIFDTDVIQPEVDASHALGKIIVAAIEKYGLIPEEIHIRKRQAWDILKPFTDRLGIRLTLQENLRAIFEARTSLEGRFTRHP